jgi:ubiquitin C-terminal hydrolase
MCARIYRCEQQVIDDGKVRKQVSFEVLPPVLLLNIARFSFDFARNIPVKVNPWRLCVGVNCGCDIAHRCLLIDDQIHDAVEYPALLTLPRNMLSDTVVASCTRNLPVQYRLQSAVLHNGKRATGGHFYAFAQNDHLGWRSINDMRVTAISDRAALAAHELVSFSFAVALFVTFLVADCLFGLALFV